MRGELASSRSLVRTQLNSKFAKCATAEWSEALDSGSHEQGSIPVSAHLVAFFRNAHVKKYTHGQ